MLVGEVYWGVWGGGEVVIDGSRGPKTEEDGGPGKGKKWMKGG